MIVHDGKVYAHGSTTKYHANNNVKSKQLFYTVDGVKTNLPVPAGVVKERMVYQ
jgi:hypothetical protein